LISHSWFNDPPVYSYSGVFVLNKKGPRLEKHSRLLQFNNVYIEFYIDYDNFSNSKKITTMKASKYQTTTNIQEVVKNKAIRNFYVFTYEPSGKCYYNVNGKKISSAKFNDMFPIELRKHNPKGSNSDKSRNWMNGYKSY
jgi:hypothetical protein